MTEEEAVVRARRFAEAEGINLGPFSHASLNGGEWLVCFQYNGPPIEEREYVDCPGSELPTGILVDDATGEADRMLWL